MAAHHQTIERYSGTLAELAAELGDLRYDALASFLQSLEQKLSSDSQADAERGRARLSAALRVSAECLASAAQAIDDAWAICEPKMNVQPVSEIP